MQPARWEEWEYVGKLRGGSYEQAATETKHLKALSAEGTTHR